MSERRFRRTSGGARRCCTWCGARTIGDEHGWQIVVNEVMPDDVHLFVRVGLTDAPARVVRVFKGGTARVLGQEFPHVRRFAKVLWSPAYFASAVGYVSESMVRRYIEPQWDAVTS